MTYLVRSSTIRMCSRSSPCNWLTLLAVIGSICFLEVGSSNLLRAEAAPGEQQAQGDDTPRRLPWTNSRITGSPDPPLPFTTERVFPKLTFRQPTELVPAPGTSRLFVLELNGNIYSFLPDSQQPDLFLDAVNELPNNDRLLGLTFHPDFVENRYCYISYGDKRGVEDGRRISRFLVSRTDPPRCDPASEQILITWTAHGHTGGTIMFGPDGYLYITAGDGGSAFPPDGRDTGQDISDLQSSILRIDVDRAANGQPYGVPADNPFVGTTGVRPEIWAYGFRNPWKLSFDPFTGDLWTGDVGWELWELVYRVERGGNYGWSVKEGRQAVRTDLQPGPTPILPPTVDHPHTEARSVTGGYTYRGSRFPELVGAYIYGDYVTGKVWGVRHDGQHVTWHEELADTSLPIVTFGEDNQGQLFLVDHAEGTIHRLVRNDRSGQNSRFPRRLSETGLFLSVVDHEPAPGVIPYQIVGQPWHDHATAQRLVALPGNSTIVNSGDTTEKWQYPRDAVFVKTLSLRKDDTTTSARRLETQILHFDGDTWRPYSYIWNEQQTDAVLAGASGAEIELVVADRAEFDARQHRIWRVPSRAECMTCHTHRAGYTIGFNPSQLDGSRSQSNSLESQLDEFIRMDIFSEPFPESRQLLCDPYDPANELQQRARSYLHINCAHCHRRGGGGNSPIELMFDHPLERTRIVDTTLTQGTFGIEDARVVAPGDPYRSVLYLRMSKLGRGRMPYLGSSQIDLRGTELMAEWIESLESPANSAFPVKKDGTRLHELVQQFTEINAADESSTKIVQRWLATPNDALRLLRAIDTVEMDEELRKSIATRAGQHSDPLIRDLFERFLPPDQRIERLGTNVDVDHLLSLNGNAERGRRIFFQRAGVQCRNCHQVKGQGVSLGPDLTQIGKKYNRSQMLETLLEPSKVIDPKYVSHVVQTVDGEVFTGLLAERTAAEIVLRDAQNKEIRVATRNVESMAAQQKSIMPDQMLRDMTEQDAADLLAFLMKLR